MIRNKEEKFLKISLTLLNGSLILPLVPSKDSSMFFSTSCT